MGYLYLLFSEWTLKYDEPDVEMSHEGARTTMVHMFYRMTNH